MSVSCALPDWVQVQRIMRLEFIDAWISNQAAYGFGGKTFDREQDEIEWAKENTR
jgi:hypothetical protein